MKQRFWMRRKRVLLPLVALAGLAVALTVAVGQADNSTIVVYNETGAPLPACRMEACGFSVLVPGLAEEGSFRWRLPDAEREVGTPIRLELATDPPWEWSGAFLEARGGYRVALRLWPQGQVESDTQISVWRSFLPGARRLAE